jgi:hypothetical protein
MLVAETERDIGRYNSWFMYLSVHFKWFNHKKTRCDIKTFLSASSFYIPLIRMLAIMLETELYSHTYNR